LILYGKPRYLGFLKIDEDHPLKKGDVVVVETTRGQELGIIAGPLTSDQEERYRRAPSGEQGEGGQKGLMHARLECMELMPAAIPLFREAFVNQ